MLTSADGCKGNTGCGVKWGFLLELDWENVRRRLKSAEMESEQHLVTVIEQEGVRKG